MSSADALVLPVARPYRRVSTRLLRSELRLLFGRRRNQILLVVLALVPVLIGVAIRVSTGEAEPGEGPPFLDRVSGNGLFLAFTGLATVVPFFLPLTMGVVSGDAVAGEAQAGTLRYLLTVPVSRTRLLPGEVRRTLAFALAASLLVALVGLLVGWALFPTGDVTLLSGTTISAASAVGRAALVALYVAASLAGLAAIGLAVSTVHRGAGRSHGDHGRARHHQPDPRRDPPAGVAAPVPVHPPLAGLRRPAARPRADRDAGRRAGPASRLDRVRAGRGVEPLHDPRHHQLRRRGPRVLDPGPFRGTLPG
jgi:ABC-2 type transport system permease protein